MACCTRFRGGRHGGDPSMACKRSGVQIPSAPPQVNGPLRRASRPIRRRRAADLQQTLNEALSELPPRRPPGCFCHSTATRDATARRSSTARVTRASIAGVSTGRPAPSGYPLRVMPACRMAHQRRAGSVKASSDSPWPPDPSSTFAMSATTLPPPTDVGATNCTLGASLSSDDFGSSVERAAKLHPLWRMHGGGWMGGVERWVSE